LELDGICISGADRSNRLQPAGGLQMVKGAMMVREQIAETKRSACAVRDDSLCRRRLLVRRRWRSGGGVLSPDKSPTLEEDAAASLAGGVLGAPVFGLGIGKDLNRAPAKLIVLPPNTVEKSPARGT
jgi:hypothetical protein